MALTGFLVNLGGGSAVCAADAAEAVVAIGARFPYVAGSQPVMCSLESSVYSAPDIFTNNILCHDLSGNADFLKAHVLRLARCDPMLFPISFTDIFKMPAPVDVTTAWLIGFTLPLSMYLVAWGFGLVVNMFRVR